MPRRSNRKNRRAQGPRGSHLIVGARSSTEASISECTVRIPFTDYFNFTTTAATVVSSMPLTPSFLGNRFQAFSALFQLYRIVELRLVLLPNVNTVDIGLGYTAEPLETTFPTTLQQIAQYPNFVINGQLQTVPSTLKLTRKQLLAAPPKWWRCVAGSESPELYEQGFLSIIASNSFTGRVGLLMDGIVEFTAPIQSGESVSRALTAVAQSGRPDCDEEVKELPPLQESKVSEPYEMVPQPRPAVVCDRHSANPSNPLVSRSLHFK